MNRLNAINCIIGRSVAWPNVAMVLWMVYTVFARYSLNSSAIWEQEAVRYLHAIIFMAAAGYTLLRDDHVRVDVLYQRFSPRGKAWVNLLGTLILLFPFCGALYYFSYDYVLNSWAIKEPSPEPLGLPFVYILKTMLWVYPATLALQGISTVISCIRELRP